MFSNLENAKVYKTALELLITTRKERDHDLKINDIIYTLTVDKYKEEKNSVAIFVTGTENYPEILKKIVTKQVELNNNVC